MAERRSELFEKERPLDDVVRGDLDRPPGWLSRSLGWNETWAAAFASPVNTQIGLDLGFAVLFGLVFLWRDAKANAINPVPFVLLSLCLGSIGLMAYGVRRLWAPASGVARGRLQGAGA